MNWVLYLGLIIAYLFVGYAVAKTIEDHKTWIIIITILWPIATTLIILFIVYEEIRTQIYKFRK